MVNTKTTLSKKVLAIVLAVACMVAFTPAIAFTQSANAASKLKVSPTKATVYVAKTKKISAKGLSKSHLKKVKWTTSKKSVVSISKTKGSYTTAKGKKAGTAYVTAKYGKYKAKAKIVVKKAVVKTAITAVTITNTSAAAGSTATTVGDKLIADTTPADATATYQWYADGTAIAGATSHSYTVGAEAVGKVITVKATGVDKYDSTATSTATTKVGTLTLNKVTLTKPNTSKTVTTPLDVTAGNNSVGVGDVLTATGLDTAKEIKDVTYQWYTDAASAGHEISGATAATYTVTKANVGKKIYVTVTPKTGILGNATTVNTDAVTSTVSIGISNENAKVGDTLNAVTTPAAAADAVTYSWQKLNTTTGSYESLGVTTATYAPTAAGTYKVTIALKTGEITYTLGTDTAKITVAKSAMGAATIKNVSAYGAGRTTNLKDDTLQVSSTTAATDYTVQWYRYNTSANTHNTAATAEEITGATTAAYDLTDADLGATVFCKITGKTGTDAAGQTATSNEITGITSAITGAITSTVSAAHVISLTGVDAAWKATYQWYRYTGTDATTATAISGATKAEYTLTTNDTGYTVFCKVSGTGSYTGTLTSSSQACYGVSSATYAGTTAGTAVADQAATLAPTAATVTYELVGTAPTGVTFNAANGTFTTTAACTAGTTHVTVTGTGNYIGTVDATFTVK